MTDGTGIRSPGTRCGPFESLSNPSIMPETSDLHWPTIAAVYAGLLLGLAWLLYWGDYRNAAWLGLIGAGGACTAYGRILRERGQREGATTWEWVSAVFYAAFFLWAGGVLVQTL